MAKTLAPGEKPTVTNSPWHLQGSQLVAVDVETTGLDPTIHEIFQIAIVALDYNFLPREDLPPFTMSMRIENPDCVDYAVLGEIGVSKDKLQRHIMLGVDQMTGIDVLLEWVERLKLPPMRRMCPIAQNWPHDRSFLSTWLGKELFQTLFHPHYRDLIPATQLLNDLHYTVGGNVPYRFCNLTELCKKFEIERVARHDALNDAVATAEIYRRMLSKYSGGFHVYEK